MSEELNVQVARLDERSRAMERRLARLEMVALAGLVSIGAAVGKAMLSSIGLPL